MKILGQQFKNPGVVPWVFIVVATLLLLALGSWQIDRHQWKQQQLNALKAGQETPPLTTLTSKQLSLAEVRYRRIEFIGQLERDTHILRIGIHRDFGNGYYILSPLLLPMSNSTTPLYVWVNRGFIPGTQAEVLQALNEEHNANPTMVYGIIRAAYAPRMFSPKNHPDKNIWSSEDMPVMNKAANLPIGVEIAPFVIEVTEEQPASGTPAPKPNRAEIRLRNDHLGYAVTWFSLALAGIIMFGFYCRVRE